MADIFLSYAREDRERAAEVAASLSDEGWSVYWDVDMLAGQVWGDVLERELKLARCVVVLWSKHSVTSRWVREEANAGTKPPRLVAALLDEVEPPFGFTTFHASNLINWRPGFADPNIDQLILGVAAVAGSPQRRSTVAAEGQPPKREGEDRSVVELLQLKRDSRELPPTDVEWLLSSYSDRSIPDYQVSALLTSVCLNGLSVPETVAWTSGLLASGERLDLSELNRPKVDKHSTGGVGDKVSLCLNPLIAACNVVVPTMSGRALGHTGGTLDKLESIAGVTTQLPPADFHRQLEVVGAVIAGQWESIAPVDRRLYALRDATATVPSVPLIASSIMAKKLAEDLDALVLDVKVGAGAFLGSRQDATKLARLMMQIGASQGVEVFAVLTAMDQPLGREVGNANEVREAIEVLNGGGPDDLVEVTLTLGEAMLIGAGAADSREEARSRLEGEISSGTALGKLAEMVQAQRGDVASVHDPSRLPQPSEHTTVPAARSGYVTRCDAMTIGVAAARLGAGRMRLEHSIDPAVGVTLNAKVGDYVEEGQPVAIIGWNDRRRMARAMDLLPQAWEIGDEPPPARPLILDIMQ